MTAESPTRTWAPPAFHASETRASSAGFSLVELMVALAIFGLLLTLATPAFKRFQESQALFDAAGQITRELRAARQKAIATGATQEIRFMYNFGGTSDYHIWNGTVANPSWRLPKNITYYWGGGTQNDYRWTSDGRCQDFGWVILENTRGLRDTVAVRTSGMIFAYH